MASRAGRVILAAKNYTRNFTTTALRRSEHETDGIPGSNLPFDIRNRYKLSALFIVFFGSGLAIPFLLLRHQLLKK